MLGSGAASGGVGAASDDELLRSAILSPRIITMLRIATTAALAFALASCSSKPADKDKPAATEPADARLQEIQTHKFFDAGVTPIDPAAIKINQELQASCDRTDHPDLEACYTLAGNYLHGVGAVADVSAAVKLYQRTCDASFMKGCFSLGVSDEEGTGVEKSFDKAVAMYKKACDGNIAAACFNLGLTYQRGVVTDGKKSAELFQKACDSGDPKSCFNLGNDYIIGDGVTKDQFKATVLFGKACDAGLMSGCYNLGVCYQHGTGVPLDAGHAMNLFQKACESGDADACKALH